MFKEKLIELVIESVNKYQTVSQTRFQEGKRPLHLPCEEGEVHCSTLFVRSLESHGLSIATREMVERCPGGARRVAGALVGSVLMTHASTSMKDYCPTGGIDEDTPCDPWC